ncbi:MAG: hypothetical protein NWT08_11845 [Akkermansiaceae bacterium]|jgi:hypothetical protein|nr:hypothetical protein [Akkermansiaceae bacterium]MDP4646363.1 hypothetical protein [Akkermansiaceae bacterium]MDP4721946.1 hypothetical protein [Akkermansiaceae bacterium]MDP4779966.1 hypothetical protein [Akkermansiaceae bacterium]MDP4847108.1 hypothetical protein [Akkermansiaceae bacterium]
MKFTALIFLFLTHLSTAEILRLSKVVEKPGEGITEMELTQGEETQAILVEDKAILTETDIAVAMPSLQQEDAVDITLTPEGTEKMIAATTPMRPAIDRIAIILNGRIKSAPVVQSVPLGKRFVISGLDEKNEPKRLAGLLTGKSDEEIDKEITNQEERLKSLPPRPEPVFYTEEEYQELSKQREHIGLYYMDRLYAEEQLDQLLSPGMTRKEVVAIFGKPNSVSQMNDGKQTLTFETAPEKLPLEKEMRMLSFTAHFKANRLTRWGSYKSGERTREPKPIPSKPGNLIIKTPRADMSSPDFDFISFFENHEISLKPGETEPTKGEILSLVGWIWSISQGENPQSIDNQCDAMKILMQHIPELQVLSEESKDGRIPLTEVEEALKPYVLGDKTLN